MQRALCLALRNGDDEAIAERLGTDDRARVGRLDVPDLGTVGEGSPTHDEDRATFEQGQCLLHG